MAPRKAAASAAPVEDTPVVPEQTIEPALPPPPPPPSAAPRNPTPPEYTTGKVKIAPDNSAVAIRTNIPDPDSDHDWGVMTVDRGGHYAGWDEVASWIDLTVV